MPRGVIAPHCLYYFIKVVVILGTRMARPTQRHKVLWLFNEMRMTPSLENVV